MKIETEFDIGETVILKTDTQKSERIITNFTINPGGTIRYCLQQGHTESWNYGIEIERIKKDSNKAGFNR